MRVSKEDLEKLQQNPSVTVRAEITQKVASGYREGQYSPAERELAQEIFRLLARDAEVTVRKALGEQLAHSMELPHDIALKLAQDVEAVSVPFLESSFALSEEDLIEITRSTEQLALLNAIARRQSISADLSSALLCKPHTEVMRTLLQNKSAHISEPDLLDLLHEKEVTGDESLLESLIDRGGLSITVAEKLFSLVSNTLKKQLTETYHLSFHVAEDAARDAREMATLGLVVPASRKMDIDKLVDQLHKKKRLTFSLILRALCRGDLRFFEASMAKLANIPTINARILILDPGGLGYYSLYESTPMPAGMKEAVKRVVDIILELTSWGRYTRRDVREQLIGKLRGTPNVSSIENMDYLISLIGSPEHYGATVH